MYVVRDARLAAAEALAACAGTSLIAGPADEVAKINNVIGAESMIVVECKAVVKQYLPQLIKIIEAATSRGICHKVGLCKAEEAGEAAAASSRAARRLLMSDQCAPCDNFASGVSV
jgi:hypothetical protein